MRPEWCPVLHTIQGNDPSGPIKVGDTWFVFADGTSAIHWESKDLLRWTTKGPGWWSGLTGAITRTPAGHYWASTMAVVGPSTRMTT